MLIYLTILEFPTVFGLIFSIFSLVQDSNVSTCQILQFQLIIITQLMIIHHFEMIKGVKMRLILNITNLCYFCYFSQFSPYSAIFSCFSYNERKYHKEIQLLTLPKWYPWKRTNSKEIKSRFRGLKFVKCYFSLFFRLSFLA